MLANVEGVSEVIVGQAYLVNVVTTKPEIQPWGGAGIPVLGAYHEDVKLLGFPYEHYHVDYRFITHAMFEHVKEHMEQRHRKNLTLRRFKNDFLGLPILTSNAHEPPMRVPLVCKRQHPLVEPGIRWMARLEFAYKNHRVSCNTCPHRGLSLVGAPEDEPGTRVCPGHGLQWDVETGQIRPRVWGRR